MVMGGGRGLAGHGRALVVIGEERVALATVLVLQEMDLAVDIAIDGDSAVHWVRRAVYDLIVCGPGDESHEQLALRFRAASPAARVVLLCGPDHDPDADADDGIEHVRPPLDVNTLVLRFWPAAA